MSIPSHTALAASQSYPAPHAGADTLRSRYADLLLVAGVVAILAMIVLPLPALLIDALVAVNIASGMVLLLVSLYLKSALEFSVFPSVLLISTLFRLALSIATTRLILLHGHAGDIIKTFGHLVAGGNLVVGMVVFLIITVVQFIVVAKGAERVAEVAARFTLDAMPGKQLSIDSDLRSGLIDKDEARRRRRELEQESKLHGSLDGAMKFVKGDAIAGIVIIVINLIGGLAIGVMQQGMEVSAAVLKYSILTIGEGMVAQIPALLSAMAAGLMVTRTADEHDRHLGDAIGRQITAKPRVLLVAAGLCVLLATVPGFPWAVFLLLGAVFASAGLLLLPAMHARWRRVSRPAREAVLRRKDALPTELLTALPTPQPALPLLLELPPFALGDEDAPLALVRRLEGVLDAINLTLGLALPRIGIRAVVPAGGHGAAPAWRLLAFEVPIAQGTLAPEDAMQAVADEVLQALRRNAPLFLGTQETSAMLAQTGHDMPDVVKEVTRALPLQRITEVLRRLVEEEVAVRNMRGILESLAESSQREKDVHALAELTRIALKRQISHKSAPDGTLRAAVLTPAFEDLIRQSIRVSNGIQQLALDPQQARQAMDTLAAAIRQTRPAVIVAALDVRRHVRKLIETDCFDTPVLSFHELMPHLQLEITAHIDFSAAPLLEAA